MEKYIEFEAEILKHERFNASYVVFPFSAEALFGKKGQVKIKVWFDEVIFYRGSLAKMGGEHLLMLTQEVRKQLGKTFGDKVKIKLCQDTEERIVEVPDEVKNILVEHMLWEAFCKQSYTHRKEQIRSISEAKKPETKQKRIEKLLKILKN